jgi:hypothetical protein
LARRGRQPGLTANKTDIADVAKGFGIACALTVRDQRQAAELAGFLFRTPGPVLAIAKIALTEDPWCLPEKDGTAIARRFRIALGLDRP